MSANDTQIGGTHYKDMAVQPWDAMRAWMSTAQFVGFLLGNVIKYAARHHEKGGIEDLRKARHYLDKLIEVHEETRASCTSVLRAAVDAMDWPGPDWSQAPEWAEWWAMDKSGRCNWWSEEPWMFDGGEWAGGVVSHQTGSFGYAGDWRDSLRKRPA